MDELETLRAARPRDTYPEERRAIARGRLLTLAAAENAVAPGRRARRAPRAARRTWRPWQAGLAAGLAAAAAIAVIQANTGSVTHPAQAHAPEGAAGVLLLAAKAAAADTPPPGTRWIVWADRTDSTATAGPDCGGAVKSAAGSAYAKLRGVLTTCPAQPPASLPGLRTVKPIKVPDSGFPAPPGLPDQPGSLLKAIYRWYEEHYRQYADSLPGHPVPPLTTAGLHAGAFDVLRLMLTSGVTSPAPAVQLQALALIPGITVDAHAHNAVGQPGIAVAIASDPAQTGASKEEIIFGARSYQDIGGVLVTPAPGGGSATETSARLWQAYYDANGKRL